MKGSQVIARSLKALGVTHMFGIVGIPVIEIAEACRVEGIVFIGFRNEQAAAYAANAWGYLTGNIGVLLTVGGPGFINALSGLANAQLNRYPMLMLSGASNVEYDTMGAFQEFPQVETAVRFTKFSARPPIIEQIPRFLAHAASIAVSGRKGAVYIDIPGNLIESECGATLEYPLLSSSRLIQILAEEVLVDKVVAVLARAKSPLIMVGELASDCDNLAAFVETSGIPFIPTPMAKGIIPDMHELCAGPARSFALKNADVVLLLGTTLNWMLHYGQYPRFRKDVTYFLYCWCLLTVSFILASDCLEDLVGSKLALYGSLKAIVSQLSNRWRQLQHRSDFMWRRNLASEIQRNKSKLEELCNFDALPMNYHRAFKEIKEQVEGQDFILVSEGANTMDISRSVFNQSSPKSRLDAGLFGTMGVGLGYAIAAHLATGKKVLCIEGDSAFGFSAMEMETICRFKLPICIIIMNNNGIYSGVSEKAWNPADIKSTALLPYARYELIATAFGAKSHFVKTPDELSAALKDSFGHASIINVVISPKALRKEQEFSWLGKLSANL